ncbi:MAG: transcription termination/antitermination NusG family protein, partial [bacterium]
MNSSASTQTESTDAGDMRWYILKVQFNREDTIREALEKRIRLSNLKSSFGEILVPTEDVVEFTRAGKRRVVKKKLYPGYLV